MNYGEYRGSLAAFLFTWPDGDTATRPNPVKLAKAGGAGLAQIDDGSGPKFGAEDLAVPLAADKNPRIVQVTASHDLGRLRSTAESWGGAKKRKERSKSCKPTAFVL